MDLYRLNNEATVPFTVLMAAFSAAEAGTRQFSDGQIVALSVMTCTTAVLAGFITSGVGALVGGKIATRVGSFKDKHDGAMVGSLAGKIIGGAMAGLLMFNAAADRLTKPEFPTARPSAFSLQLPTLPAFSR